MEKRPTLILVLVIIVAFISAGLFMPGFIGAGNMEPSDVPGPTMKTLDQIPPTWSQKLQCDQTACPRFELVMGGYAVLDKETGLVWAKDASLGGNKDWYGANSYCYDVGIGGRKGWRLPKVEELASLLDPQQSGSPYLPSGHPFINVQHSYWSATTAAYLTSNAWIVSMGYSGGGVFSFDKSDDYSVWPVRGGR